MRSFSPTVTVTCASLGYKFFRTHISSVLFVSPHTYHWTVYIKDTARAHAQTVQSLSLTMNKEQYDRLVAYTVNAEYQRSLY